MGEMVLNEGMETKHPQQRRYCDQDDHGMGTDAEADRYCYLRHDVKMPQVTNRLAED